jgi:hypothetical protein
MIGNFLRKFDTKGTVLGAILSLLMKDVRRRSLPMHLRKRLLIFFLVSTPRTIFLELKSHGICQILTKVGRSGCFLDMLPFRRRKK